MDTGDIKKKFEGFGFNTIAVNGHNYRELYDALTKKADKPIAIIMDTVKGKGVKEAEETLSNHSMTMKTEVYDNWLELLNSELKAIAE